MLLKQAATVVKINEQEMWVSSARQSACGNCTTKAGCGASILDNYFDNKARLMSVRLGDYRAEDFQAGDSVMVGLQEGALIKGSFLVYILPLIFMFGFAFFGQVLSVQFNSGNHVDGVSIIFGFLGLVSGFYLANYVSKHYASKKIKGDAEFTAVLLGLSK